MVPVKEDLFAVSLHRERLINASSVAVGGLFSAVSVLESDRVAVVDVRCGGGVNGLADSSTQGVVLVGDDIPTGHLHRDQSPQAVVDEVRDTLGRLAGLGDELSVGVVLVGERRILQEAIGAVVANRSTPSIAQEL